MEKYGTYSWIHPQIPRNFYKSFLDLGGVASKTALICSLWGKLASEVMICPRKSMQIFPNCHFLIKISDRVDLGVPKSDPHGGDVLPKCGKR